jgi:hypothetical protein
MSISRSLPADLHVSNRSRGGLFSSREFMFLSLAYYDGVLRIVYSKAPRGDWSLPEKLRAAANDLELTFLSTYVGRSDPTVELTRRRKSKHPSPHQAS